MHLNRFGKSQIARQIMRVTDEKTDRPISLGWKLVRKRTDTSPEKYHQIDIVIFYG
jgi:hypothetical protein